MGEIRAHLPFAVEGVLESSGCMNRIRRLVIRVDDIARSLLGRSGQASRIGGNSARSRSCIHGLKRSDPTVLCQVVVIEAEPHANHYVPVLVWRVRDSEAWRERVTVIVRRSGRER